MNHIQPMAPCSLLGCALGRLGRMADRIREQFNMKFITVNIIRFLLVLFISAHWLVPSRPGGTTLPFPNPEAYPCGKACGWYYYTRAQPDHHGHWLRTYLAGTEGGQLLRSTPISMWSPTPENTAREVSNPEPPLGRPHS